MAKVHVVDAVYDVQFAIMDARRERDEIDKQSSGASKDTRMQRVMAAAARKRGKAN
jgi:hypothetical protein